ncbi:MAG: GTPase ObgE [bacterium]|nr:GTPase ObgE [bacterium]
MFVDKVKIYVKSGHGGAGCVSFRREKSVPKGGPDGGDGGCGGSVYIQADSRIKTLIDLYHHPHIFAGNGEHGEGSKRTGKNGKDIIISVPVGTVVKEIDPVDDSIVKQQWDLIKEKEPILLARGGRGGKGNAWFATATHQTPRFAQPGEPGEEKKFILELKLIADVGLVGCPNAGKSTLLSRISAAKPKIADYPFTTKEPILGQVKIEFGKSFVIADIPGLIEGAHAGRGLGHEFLRHIERTKVLIHLVDVEPPDGSDPFENFMAINQELSLYNPILISRPQVVGLNKIDLLHSMSKIANLKRKIRQQGYEVFAISALTGNGVNKLIYRVAELLDNLSSNK